LRVAYLINRYPTISHVFIRREMQALERQGIEIQRIALRGWDIPVVDQEDEQERSRTRYVLQDGLAPLLWAVLRMLVVAPRRLVAALGLALRMGWRAERPLPYHLAYLAEACRIVPWLRASGAAHVHAHFGTNAAEVAMLVHALGGPRYSFTVHGPTEFDRPQFLGIAEKVRRSAFVVAISSYCRSQLYRWVSHADWPKVKVVHCGLDAAFHEGAVPPLPAATARLVTVGRLTAAKGQLLLVEAARRLAEKGVRFELVMVGDGEMRAEVEALVARHGLEKQVRVAGSISTELLREELLDSRGLVLASFAEGLPMVIMEAMALRRPVLTTYVAGIPELVRSGETGWLFPAGSIDALTAAMEDCLSRPVEELRAMGEAGHARALARHSVEAQATQLAALFHDPLGAAAQPA
jgi:glycosyltransferase involved in cell wall biosynthesis